MRLYSYILTYDTGFAPNPYHGYCTLATCKPKIRRSAQVGDWIIGTGSKNMNTCSKRIKIDKSGYLVYAMRVTEVLTFNEYWNAPRFKAKRPVKGAGKKWECGDNIYFRDPDTGELAAVEWSYHLGQDDKCGDTSVDRVLIGEDFVYWGGDGPPMPPEFSIFVSTTQGHKCRFPEEDVRRFVEWLRGTREKGIIGEPTGWS